MQSKEKGKSHPAETRKVAIKANGGLVRGAIQSRQLRQNGGFAPRRNPEAEQLRQKGSSSPQH